MLDHCWHKFLLTVLCKPHKKYEVSAVPRLTPTLKTTSDACCFTHTLNFKELSVQKRKLLTLICVKLHPAGGPAHSIQEKSSDTEQSSVDPEGNVLLLLRGEQGQELRGQAHPSSGKMERCQECITTAAWSVLSCSWSCLYSVMTFHFLALLIC